MYKTFWFGVFKNYAVNPSWEAVKILGETWDDPENKIFTEQIPVEYDFVLNNVPNKCLRSFLKICLQNIFFGGGAEALLSPLHCSAAM